MTTGDISHFGYWDINRFPCNSGLFRSVHSVAGVSKTGDNIAFVIEMDAVIYEEVAVGLSVLV